MRKIIALLLLLSAAPRLSCAQTASGGVEFFQTSLNEILDTPLLAASYSEERPSDTAATAYVVTAETIRKRGYVSLVDLLGDLPQFQVQRNSDVRRLNLASVRGITNNERIVILYDGVRVTPPTGDLMALAGQFSLKYAERVEVVLGPMSSVYGADAFSGVINVVTRSAAPTGARFEYGSFNSRTAAVSASASLEDGGTKSPSVSLTYTAEASDNPKLPDIYRQDYAWYNNQYKSGLAQISPYNSSTVGVPVRPYDTASRSEHLGTRVLLGGFELGMVKMRESHSSSIGVKPELTLYSSDARFSTSYWTVYGRNIYKSPGETWTLTSLLTYYDYQIDPETRFINSFSGYQDAYKYASARTGQLQETLSFDAGNGTPVLLGFSYQENSVLPYTADLGHKFNTEESPVSQHFVYSGSTIPVDFHSLRYNNIGAFMRVQRDLGNAALSIGLRYDDNTAYGETWNPRAGLVWRPEGTEATVIKMLYGEAYLAPSPFNTHKHFGSFISSGNASGYYSYFFHIPNEDLKPEKTRSAEASVTHNFGRDLRVSLNPYYNKVRDLIQDVTIGPGTFHGVPVETVERAENRGTMETYGATLRADAVLTSGGWVLEPWAAYTNSQGQLKGDAIPFNSRHVLQAGISILRNRWCLTPKALYRSQARDQDGTTVAPFTVIDLFIRYSAGRVSGFSAWAKVSNLLDRRYYNAAYGGGADHLGGAPQDPFGVSAGAGYRF